MITAPSTSEPLLATARDNSGRILGSGVSYAVRAKATLFLGDINTGT
jgi:hypothetical protein